MNSRCVFFAPLAHLPLLGLGALLCLAGCRSNDRLDTVLSSRWNPSHTYRATVLIRQYYVDGKFDNSPTTYVLLEHAGGGSDGVTYRNGEDFPDSEVVMKPSQCGPLSVEWEDEAALTIRCEKCGLALTAVGRHVEGMGPVRIDYDGFPETSSWEGARD